MDVNIATIIITIITGIFSIITIKIQKTEGSLINKIDEQAVFIKKEKAMQQKLLQAEKKRDTIIEQITLFSMKINTHIILSIKGIDEKTISELKQTSIELENSYKEISEYIKTTSNEYELLIDILNAIQDDIRKIQSDKKTS